MSQTIAAIQTKYAGCHCRSRLEARWAVFFDALNIRWKYEWEGFNLPCHGSYLPDFWLPDGGVWLNTTGIWVEIKGCLPKDHWLETDTESKMLELCQTTGRGGIIFFGLPSIVEDLYVSEVSVEEDKSIKYPSRGIGIEHAYQLPNYGAWGNRLDAAVMAATSARFEFGETPEVRR